MKVLVVDDEPGVRAALQRALTLERHDVRLAEDGQVALDTLAEGTVDAIVLDVMMPRVDGLEVCRRLRAAGASTTYSAPSSPSPVAAAAPFVA